MAFAIDTYTGNGSLTTFSVTFPYIEQAHVIVTVDGVTKTLTTDYTFATSSTITFGTAPTAGQVIKFTRSSNRTTRLTDYQDGSTLTEATLDQDGNQTFFMAQEAIDITENTIGLNASDAWDANNKKIVNVTDPTTAQGVATKNYVDSTTATSVTNAANSATASANSATASANSATASASSATAAQTAQTAAEAALDTFDDRFLGAKSSDPSVDNDGNALVDGALYFDTTNDLMKVYNLGNTTWYQLALTGSNQTAVNNVNTNIAAITNLNSNISAVTTVNSNLSNITSVNSNSSNINSAVSNASNINTVAGISGNVTTVAGISSDVTTVAGDATDIGTVAGISSNITSVAGMSSAINTVNSNSSNINSVAGAITNVNNVGGAITAINTVNSNLAAVQNFADVYRISSSAPTSSLNVGDLYFDTTANELKVYKSSGWAAAGSTVNGTSQRYTYTISGTPTTVTGADDNGNTLAYDAGYADIYLNGIRMSGADITITSGTSVVFSSALQNGDLVDIVAYGTFNVATVAGSAITSGTINDARLPTTMAGKTLTTATVEANSLTARGDGSSADGKINLNCSQNSHAVKIQSPAHSAGQSYTLVLPTSVGTNGQVLATNGNQTNQLSWVDAQETKPTITSSNFYISPSTSQTFTINGTNFVQFPKVEFISSTGVFTPATAVSYTSATALSVTVTLSNGAYRVKITNPDGNAGISGTAICNASTAPTWNTAQALGSFAGNFSGTLVTLSASSDSTITYSEVGSNLTTGNMTLSGANITTTDFGGSSTSPTQYSFTIRATDLEGQYLDRAFTINSTFGATGGAQFN
jgi:hypothetical protein